MIAITHNKEVSRNEQIQKLVARKEAALYQRKITTQIDVVWQYNQEIARIDERIQELQNDAK